MSDETYEVCRFVPFEVTRADEDGLTLEGYAAVFNSPTLIDSWEGRFEEVIERGAFAKTIESRTPVLQFDHGTHPLIGSIPLGTIKTLREDSRGLFVRARLSDNWLIEPIRDAIRDGAVNGMSFRFRVIIDEIDNQTDPPLRTLKEVSMPELGPVVFPAYEDTSVGVRDMTNELALRMEQRFKEQRFKEQAPIEIDEPPAGEVERDEDPGTLEEAAPQGTSDEAASNTDEPPARHSAQPEPSTETRSFDMDAMSVEERAARQSEIRARLEEIDSEHTGSALPDSIQEEWDRLTGEYNDHETAIVRDKERKDQLRSIADRGGPNVEDGDGTGRKAPATRVGQDNIFDLSAVRNRARSIDELPELYRDNAMRVVEQAKFPGIRNKEDSQAHVERLLSTVDDGNGTLARRILATGSPLYARAFGKAVLRGPMGLTAEEQRALSVGTDSEGGYAVPFQLDPTVILTSDGSINPLRQISRVEQITTKTWQGVTSEGITVSRANESAEATDDAPTLAQPEVTPTRVHGFVPFSIEVDQDWGALQSEMTRLLADAKEQEEADSFINGDGTGNNPGGVIATLAAASEVDDSAGTFADSHVYELEEELAPRFRARARFLANKSTYNTIRQFADADGHDLWERLGAGQPAALLGYPAHEASEVPSHGTSGNRYLLFGDFNQFLIVDRVGMSVELIPHLVGANRRPTGQRGIYAIWRNSSLVLVDNAFRVLVDASA